MQCALAIRLQTSSVAARCSIVWLLNSKSSTTVSNALRMMWFCVISSSDARFVNASRASKACSCHVDDSVRESWLWSGRIADVDGRAELNASLGLTLMRSRDRACAVAGWALEGKDVVPGFEEEVVVEAMCSQVTMSSLTAPCWVMSPRLFLSLLRFRRIWLLCERTLAVPFLQMCTSSGTVPASRTRLHRAVACSLSRRSSGAEGF